MKAVLRHGRPLRIRHDGSPLLDGVLVDGMPRSISGISKTGKLQDYISSECPSTHATKARKQGANQGRKGLHRRGPVLKLRTDRAQGQGQKGDVAFESCRAHAGARAALAGRIHRIAKGPQLVLHLVRDSL